MESIIKVKFLKINRKNVNKELLEKNPKLPEVTEKTTKILCNQIKKYFHDNRIEVKVDYELK